jgi:hypothetical protein
MHTARPDIIGGTTGWHGDGEFTQTVYFSSEKDAREGEAKETPDSELGAAQEFMSLMTDLRFYDLRQPWTYSP